MKQIFIVLAFVLTCSTMFAKQPQRPNSYNYQRGVEALVEGEVATGIDYLNKEIEENPKNGYAHGWIAAARASQSEYGAALTAVNKAMQYIPKKDVEYTSWAYSMRANIYLELEDTVAALKDFNQAIKIDPSNEDYFESRADILFNQGNYDEANKDYQHIISLNPGSVIGYMGLGRNLKEQGEYEKAIELFSYVIKIHPEYSSGYSFRAEVYLKQKRYNEAADDILTALDIDEDRKAYYLLITEYTDPTTLNLLKGKFQIKKTKEPNNVYWSYYYGLVLENNRLFRDAIEQYQTCKRINASTLFDEQIAYCYSKMGDFERALEYVNYAIAVDSTDADYYEERANIYGEMGNRAKAIEDLTKYIEFYPEYSYAYYRRGWYKHLDLQHEAAIEDFNLSIMLDSTYNYAYDGRGRSYVALGKTDLAKADFEKILSFDTIPNDNSCASSAYHFLGQDSLAIDFMRRTLKEDSTAYYDAACTFALAGQIDSAVFYLRKAFENGFVRLHHISVDMDFDAIRQDERFKTVVEEYTLKIQQANSSEDNAQSNEERIVEVPFTAANGVTKVNCTINGLPLNFVFDTGASDVTISQVEANFMFKNGYLSEKDIVGKQHYQTADGNISVGTVINLNSINFGGLSLNNIRASVVQSQNAPLLLGQSVLQRLGKIEIDNSQRILKITTKQ